MNHLLATANKIPKLLIIVGETASGKSALALRLAQQYQGEIICADSWTVRREADIGTAKPTAADRSKVPHHLLDVVGPDEDFTAAVFKRLANKAIDEIAARSRLPIMVGGTGLYVDSVIYDYGFLPAGNRQDRQKLNQLSRDQLLAKIKTAGFRTERIDTNNKRRLIRLLETDGRQPSKKPLRPNTLMIGLRTDREVLKKRIITRTDAMLAAGLEAEVKRLARSYGWNCEALKGISYSQWQDYFAGTANLEETRQKIIKATLGLAKRQRTWFKRNRHINWIATPVKQSEVVALVTTFIKA